MEKVPVRWRESWAFPNPRSIAGCSRPRRRPWEQRASSATEELKVLRRELEQVRMERDILKKAVAFFAKESG